MIIFYNKKTRDIFGVVDGRVFDDSEKQMIHPQDMDKSLIGKYVVPYKQKLIEIEVPIEKWFIKNKKTLEVEKRVVGNKKETVSDGMIPNVNFADLITDFEYGRKNIYDYRVILDNKKTVIGFEFKV